MSSRGAGCDKMRGLTSGLKTPMLISDAKSQVKAAQNAGFGELFAVVGVVWRHQSRVKLHNFGEKNMDDLREGVHFEHKEVLDDGRLAYSYVYKEAKVKIGEAENGEWWATVNLEGRFLGLVNQDTEDLQRRNVKRVVDK